VVRQKKAQVPASMSGSLWFAVAAKAATANHCSVMGMAATAVSVRTKLLLRRPGELRRMQLRQKSSGRTQIRAFLAGLTVLALGSGAQAQFGVPGGIAPYTINDPAAAAAGGYGGGSASCYWQSRGRGGGETQCPVRPPATPNKPAEAGKK
jgi:hypothetical protein